MSLGRRERLKISLKEADRIANEIWGHVYLVRRVRGGFEVLLHSATGPRHLLDDFGIEVAKPPFPNPRGKKLRFRDLNVGDIFFMQSAMLLARPFSDGPWVKTGRRTYKALNDLRGVGEIRVGSINVEVSQQSEYHGRNPGPRRTKRRAGLIKDMRFFREHGAMIVGEGSRVGLDLARAEREMKKRGWDHAFVPEYERYEDVYGEKPPEGAEFATVVLLNTEFSDRWSERELWSHVIGSLGFVDTRDSKYVRVVVAELALEALAQRRK